MNRIKARSKEYDELYAKCILEYLFPEYCLQLVHCDKPDLISDINHIGIEVTSTISKESSAAVNLWLNHPTLNEKQCNRLESYAFEVGKGHLIHPPKEYPCIQDDSVYTPIWDLVKEKLIKLNTGYISCEKYYLYILTDLDLHLVPPQKIIEKIHTITSNSFERVFSIIFIATNENTVLMMDLDTGRYDNRSFDDCQTTLAKKAHEMELTKQTS